MNKVPSRNEMIKMLNKHFPKIWTKPGEDFDSSHKDTIWTGEGSAIDFGNDENDWIEAFNYYSEDYKEVLYVMGVAKVLHEFLEGYGWYAEAYDAGTYFLAKA